MIKSSPTVLPFQAVLHCVQDDRLFDYCHSEPFGEESPGRVVCR